MKHKLPVKYKELRWYERREVREQYIEEQDGDCCFCKKPLEGPPARKVANKIINRNLFPGGFFEHPVHLHHSHKTGLTIGAVHSRCNAYLWQVHGE